MGLTYLNKCGFTLHIFLPDGMWRCFPPFRFLLLLSLPYCCRYNANISGAFRCHATIPSFVFLRNGLSLQPSLASFTLHFRTRFTTFCSIVFMCFPIYFSSLLALRCSFGSSTVPHDFSNFRQVHTCSTSQPKAEQGMKLYWHSFLLQLPYLLWHPAPAMTPSNESVLFYTYFMQDLSYHCAEV